MILKRKIYKKLLEWKKECQGKKALLIEGARRIGKSTICEEFGKNEYESYLLIDFAKKDKEVEMYFERYLNDMDTFFMLLQTHFGKKLTERNSLIIFDEVQMFPQARAAIKYLVADGRYDYIETGSLISIRENVKNIVIPSEERHINMYPLDFEEFAIALEEDLLVEYIKKCFEKRVVFKKLQDGSYADQYEETFFWLSDSMISNECFLCNDPNVGLSLNETRSYVKCYMGDTGLLVSHAFDENELLEDEVYKQILAGKLQINEGMLYENAIAQMLVANGHKLYFYTHYNENKHRNDMEIDFIISNNSRLKYKMFPIEVKSGKQYKTTSLNNFREKYKERIGESYIIHPRNLIVKDGIICIPPYMTMNI